MISSSPLRHCPNLMYLEESDDEQLLCGDFSESEFIAVTTLRFIVLIVMVKMIV
jgi:hypothetical protein